ncbi:hypothetical protein CONLIGDRAFT_438663 [Coniochaeta ligniaria NRRL 30616]|uniref:Survival Motor Neuron Gemin2-binding domain-containing protein n=1 Tax=Coniochaeta ligniaria NRRL 30616 TaxID=1408157 RepID=A0A1J7IJ87_9PEZI|nr:hypothetical protein CONLIGDRAFT_438663 [Coniochaeta ligniaria NRRL 30616]
MNHDEIWDDSALIESWNDALAEYKKYHSIHVKGGSVYDLPPNEPQIRPDAKPETRGSSQPMDESEVEERHETAIGDAQSDDARQGEKSLDDGARPPAVAGPAGSGVLGPQMLLGSVQDEGLKKLLMSWYYAGYYTGLYEGQQQQAKQQSQA